VTGTAQLHGNDSFGYRVEQNGKSVIYTTDSEHKPEDAAEMKRAADFFRDADLVIFDAMYSLADSVSVKEDWGHSSNILGVELCQMAGAKSLCLFIMKPVYSDEQIDNILAGKPFASRKSHDPARPLRIVTAYDGLVIEI